MWSDRKQQLWIWRERGSRVEGQVDWEHRLQSLLAAWKALSAKSQYSSPHSSPHSSLSMLRQEPWKRLIRRPKNNSHTFVHNPRLGSSRQSAEDVSNFPWKNIAIPHHHNCDDWSWLVDVEMCVTSQPTHTSSRASSQRGKYLDTRVNAHMSVSLSPRVPFLSVFVTRTILKQQIFLHV